MRKITPRVRMRLEWLYLSFCASFCVMVATRSASRKDEYGGCSGKSVSGSMLGDAHKKVGRLVLKEACNRRNS